MYGFKAKLYEDQNRWERRAADIYNLHYVIEIGGIDKASNEDLRRLCGVKKSLEKHMDKSHLWWYGCVECLINDKLIMKIYSIMAESTVD